MDISKKWDSLSIDEKIKIIAVNTSYENVYVNHFDFYVKICMEKFNDLPDIQYGRLKDIITIALIS